MSTPSLETPAAHGMSLGDPISTTGSEQDDNMADESSTTPEPVTVTETPTKVKKARKTPVKKQKPVVENGENSGDTGDADTETPAKAKKPRKTPVKKEKVKPEEGDDAEADAEPTTPKAAPKKRGPVKKKADATPTPATPTGVKGDIDTTTPATNGAAKSSGKKRGPAAKAVGETPTKKAKASGEPRAKAPAVKFPESWAEFMEEDKLIVNMRKAGKGWSDIETAWAALTGKTPGKDSIRKRYPKLEAVSQDFKDEDLPLISDAKKIVDEETEAAIKKLKAEAWSKIADRVKTAGGDDYKGAAIEKKWAAMKKSNLVNSKGEYIVPAPVEVDDDMENLSVADNSFATNGNGHIEDDADAEGDAMEE